VTGDTNISRWVGFLHVVKPYLHALVSIPMLALPIWLQMLDDGGPRRDHNACRWQFLCLWLSSKLWQHTTYSSVGRQNAINMLRNNIWMAPCEFKEQRTHCVWTKEEAYPPSQITPTASSYHSSAISSRQHS
jgi:hypothetical protein